MYSFVSFSFGPQARSVIRRSGKESGSKISLLAGGLSHKGTSPAGGLPRGRKWSRDGKCAGEYSFIVVGRR